MYSTFIDFVDFMKKERWIDDRLAAVLKRRDSVAPRSYGLPRIHKDSFPLRPIISAITSSTESSSLFLAGILSHIRDDELSLRSSGDLQAL